MIKKDKLFELKIEEDDDISGIDSISLVDEPAIEINWMYFNKVKQQEFHIPDNEDEKYLEKLKAIAQDEQELLDEGWVVSKVTPMGREGFITAPDPNAPSVENEKEYRVRYKYVLNPAAGTNPVIDTTRDFCRELVQKNYVWRLEDLDALTNDEGDSALVWRGGYNCRHLWARIEYNYDDTIRNKAGVNQGKIDPQAPLDTRVLGMEQPDTRVPEWPSFSKQVYNSIDIYGYKTRFFHICPGAQETFKHLISMDNDEDTIGMIRSAAQVADNVFRIEDEVIKSGEATSSQLQEAIVLVDDFKDIILEIDKISGMKHDVSYMDGHIDKIKEYVKEELGYDVSTIGGYQDPGVKKKKKKNFEDSYSDYPESVRNNAKAVLKYVEENGWGSCGTEVGKIRANQLANGEPVSLDTVKRMYSYLSRHEVDLESSKGYGDGCGRLMYDSWGGKSAMSWAQSKINQAEKMSKQKFVQDEEKRIIIGPAMVPDLRIPRRTKNGEMYEVFFSAETIKMIAEKYMKNQYTRNNDLNHDGTAVKDVYVVESWIKEDENDKSTKYGYGDLSVGTWFVAMKVAKTPEGDKVWEMVKNGELAGYSVSGWFEEVAQFCRDEMFLKQVVEILKRY
jgi:hypothetical protein